MAKDNWQKHKEVEDKIKKILKKGSTSINKIRLNLISLGESVSYGLVQRRVEYMEKNNIIEKLDLDHQVKFWKLK